jgi:hypothetical protein
MRLTQSTLRRGPNGGEPDIDSRHGPVEHARQEPRTPTPQVQLPIPLTRCAASLADLEDARALFDSNAFDFERWAVSLVDGQAHERHEQAGDRGVDGWIRFPATGTLTGRAVVSVKGGRQLNPAMVRDLRGTVESPRADMGLLVTLEPRTRGMLDEAHRSGSYPHSAYGTCSPARADRHDRPVALRRTTGHAHSLPSIRTGQACKHGSARKSRLVIAPPATPDWFSLGYGC